MSQKTNKSTQQSDDETQLMEEIAGNSEEESPAEIEEPDSDLASDQFENDSREELIEKLLTAHTEIDAMKDGYIRAKADVENIQRRSQNEMISARKFAIEGFARELLSVIDSLEQASRVEMDKSNAEVVDKMKEGLALTLKQFDTVMEKFGVTAVEAEAGVKFNPELHQAISMVPSGDVEPEHILSVMQKGFMLKDRLLRPAMVVIATTAES
jgi:molecular chaperone GrpE